MRSTRVALALIAAGLAVAAVAVVLAARSAAPAPASSARARAIDTGVVDVYTTLGYSGSSAAGTGIVLTSSGEVLTNNHVIRGATAIRVIDVQTGRRYRATVLGYNLVEDVALIRVSTPRGLRPAAFGDSSQLHVGDPVTAVGNAGGTGGAPSVTHGTITGLHRSLSVSDDQGGTEQLTDLIRIDAPLAPGDSGGPLLSRSQRVIGINTAASTSFQFQPGGAVGFAIPINRALAIAHQIEKRRPSAAVHVGPTAFLGVSVDPSDASGGALVRAVVPGTPADRAGLTPGVTIVAVGGRRVTSPGALTRLMLHVTPGKPVQLTWLDELGGAHSASVRPAVGPPQ